MTPVVITLIVIVVILAVIALAVVAMYNGLVQSDVKAKEAWSGITVQLKRRADLIPNLVEAVKGYAAHESGVFERVTEARAAVAGAADNSPAAAAKADGAYYTLQGVKTSKAAKGIYIHNGKKVVIK